jgi:hypothetical protein
MIGSKMDGVFMHLSLDYRRREPQEPRELSLSSCFRLARDCDREHEILIPMML